MDLLIELETLALALEGEVAMCQSRAHHIRAASNASLARRILSQVQAGDPAAPTQTAV